MTIIGAQAFQGCTSLPGVTIPKSVTDVGDEAFRRCTSLSGIYFEGNAPRVGWDVFTDDPSVTVYFLPGTTGWGTSFGGRPTEPKAGRAR